MTEKVPNKPTTQMMLVWSIHNQLLYKANLTLSMIFAHKNIGLQYKKSAKVMSKACVRAIVERRKLHRLTAFRPVQQELALKGNVSSFEFLHAIALALLCVK